MDISIRDVASLLQQGKDGYTELMKKNDIGKLLADIINAHRLDNKRLAQEYDLDMEVQKLSGQKTREAIAELMEGDADKFAQIMDELQQQRNEILEEALSDEEYQEYYKQRESSLELIGDPEFNGD